MTADQGAPTGDNEAVEEIPPHVESAEEQGEAVSDDTISVEEFKKRSRRSVLVGGVAVAAGAFGWRWVQTQPLSDGTPEILRKGHELNERIWSSRFGEGQLARTYDKSKSEILRVNGVIGIFEDLDFDNWEMTVEDPRGSEIRTMTLSDVKAFDRREMTVKHKCVEGWSQITTWAGTRFSDLFEEFEADLSEEITNVYLETPSREYYVSVDIDTMLHPQTLLAYDMLDGPLDLAHGAPLRLVTPLKYGTKQLKQIGLIRFETERAPDYWGERGYDWYAGL